MANPNVRKANTPHKPLRDNSGHQSVAKGKQAVQRVSAGKMPGSAGGVSLGTTKGNTNVAHPL